MTDLPKRPIDSNLHEGNLDDSLGSKPIAATSDHKILHNKSLKTSFLTSFFTSTLSIFERHPNSVSVDDKPSKSRSYGWTTSLKRVIGSGSMRRLHDRILGSSKGDLLNSKSETWFLGKCYKLSLEDSSHGSEPDNNFTAFLEDFSSRIWITYRKGFEPISDSKFACDVNWGCMIRSSQMLVAQALILHHMGRSWRKSLQKPYNPQYIEILHLFGDSSTHEFSIHNLLRAGKVYGLAAGSWLGPYAMCRTWEAIVHANKEQVENRKCKQTFPMVLYIVSGDKDGEQGGAPVICVEHAAKLCHNFSKEQLEWAPIILLVPLVLGLEKINPRYVPLLWETFTFPQSLGILGGKPGVSTYIVGVQDEKALYLDPHEVQPVVDIKRDDLEADCSSYHCSTVRHMPLDMIDPSLAIGFYCRDRDDFEDFCSRASQLEDKSNGAPLFTIIQHLQPAKPIRYNESVDRGTGDSIENFNIDDKGQDDEWQIL